MAAHKMLALDVGTSSVRTLIGAFDGEKLSVEEFGRFYHTSVDTPGGVLWNMYGIHNSLEENIAKVVREHGAVNSLALDSWGSDVACIDHTGELITFGISSRDPRFVGVKEKFFEMIPRREVFERTGSQFLNWNTLFLLYDMAQRRPWLVDGIDKILFSPDIFIYLLTGEKICDYSISTTSQMTNPFTRDWDMKLLHATGIPESCFLKPELGRFVGKTRNFGIDVYSGCSHDTAAAVVGTPLSGKNELYIIAGSWAMFGAELDTPVVSDAVMRTGFSNEGGANGKIRFLRNTLGMWMFQESRRQWAREGMNLSFGEMAQAGAQAEAYRSIIDVNDPRLQLTGDLPGRVREICAEMGQPIPETVGEVMRCLNDSLSFKFRILKEGIEECTGQKYDVIRVIAGGSQDASLCQSIADITHCRVIAGPVEASAFGNCLTQMVGAGLIRDFEEGRELVRRSVEMKEYEPRNNPRAEEVFERMRSSIDSMVAG